MKYIQFQTEGGKTSTIILIRMILVRETTLARCELTNSYVAATSHAIKAEGGERMYLCPLVDANKGFKSGAVRMDTVKI